MLLRSEREQGVSIAGLARKHGVSRQTIYNVLEAGSSLPKQRALRVSMLDPFKEFINAKLVKFDVPASSLLRDIKRLGYGGGMTIVKDFVRSVKGERVRQVIERFETIPGQQAQVDWGECGSINVDGVARKLYVFVMVLGYSRMLFASFAISTRRAVLLTMLRSAFERLGVPRELLVDNMRTAVERHVSGEAATFNAGFLDFCEHYGTVPLACPPYWPRAKGKVEAGVKYVKYSFLNGRSFTTLKDLNEQLDVWLDDTANVRLHGTTRERPSDRFASEVAFLRPAAAVPRFDTRELWLRLVHSDSHVRLFNTAYSVPPSAVGKTVQLRLLSDASGSPFQIMLGSDVLAAHKLALKGVQRVTLPQHAALIKVAAARARRPQPRKALFEQITAAPAQAGLQPRNAPAAAPDVQLRSLDEYDRLLQPA